MQVAVEYKNGRIKEYDVSGFVPSEAARTRAGSSRNVATEYDLRIDRIEDDGLVLNIFWHDQDLQGPGDIELDDTSDENGNPVKLPRVPRRGGVSIMLVNQEVLEEVSRIMVYRANGTVQAAWRQGRGNWLINGALFEAQKVLTYTDSNTTSLNAQAVFVHDYLKNAHPDLDEGEIAELMGYPEGAYKELVGEEINQQGPVVPAETFVPMADDGEVDDPNEDMVEPDPYGDMIADAGDDAYEDDEE